MIIEFGRMLEEAVWLHTLVVRSGPSMRSVTFARRVLGMYPGESSTSDEGSTSDEEVPGVFVQNANWSL